jgi:hypothetical protein
MIVLAKNPELRRQMGEVALRRYRMLFSPGAVMPLMLETYARVAGRARPREFDGVSVSSHPWSSFHQLAGSELTTYPDERRNGDGL